MLEKISASFSERSPILNSEEPKKEKKFQQKILA